MDFERSLRKSKSIPLISLIDVVFQLLIYFMISTSFTRSESLELALPSAKEANRPSQVQGSDATMHIYISDNGETFIEHKSYNEQDMQQELKNLLTSNPDSGFLVLSASKVPVQTLVHVLDRIYTAGGKNIAVADWIMPQAQGAQISPVTVQIQGSHG